MTDQVLFIDGEASFYSSDDREKIAEIIENIETLTADYLQDINAESVTDITQQQYFGMLSFIAMKYIRPSKIMYKHIQGSSHEGNISFMFNDNLIDLLSRYYIYMCQKYNKIANPYGFCTLIGSDLDVLARWERQEDQRPRACGTAKRLRKAYETGLENGAQSVKNPVGFIATLNHRFGWSADNKPALTVNITRNQDQILQSFDSSLITEKPATP